MREWRPRVEMILLGLACLTTLSALGFQTEEPSAGSGRSGVEQEWPKAYVEQPAERPGPVVIAHRAGAAKAPENTLAALERAISDGADMAEIDVRQTGDGVLVVLHDDSFGRTTGLDRKVWELDCPSARELDAGGWYGKEFSGECVPTLEEMLEKARGRIPLMIELKAEGCRPDLTARTVEAVQAAGMEGECVLASSCEELLRQAKQLAPELETVYIGRSLPEGAADWADGYSLDVNTMTGAEVDKAHAQGKEIRAWTVNTKEEIEKALELGVDGLVTDDPALARSLCRTDGEGA